MIVSIIWLNSKRRYQLKRLIGWMAWMGMDREDNDRTMANGNGMNIDTNPNGWLHQWRGIA